MLIPLLVFSLHLVGAEVTIDLATAMFDENLQQFCVQQKVCWLVTVTVTVTVRLSDLMNQLAPGWLTQLHALHYHIIYNCKQSIKLNVAKSLSNVWLGLLTFLMFRSVLPTLPQLSPRPAVPQSSPPAVTVRPLHLSLSSLDSLTS